MDQFLPKKPGIKFYFFLNLRPLILQADRAVEDQVPGGGLNIHAEVAQALKLEFVARLGILQARFQQGLWDHLAANSGSGRQ